VRDLYDQRLTDPTAEAVARALLAAIAAAVGTRRLGSVALEFGERVVANRDGCYQTRGSADSGHIVFTSLAWFTTASGFKCVRVRAWRAPRPLHEEPGTRASARLETEQHDRNNRPAVWYLDPERVFEFTADGRPEWVAVCGCGAVGGAESLGWQHGMCGPCADRVAEFGVAAVAHAPGLLTCAGDCVGSVAFGANGTVLAGGPNWFRVWDAAGALLAGGKISNEPGAERFVPQIQVRAEGRFALICGVHDRLLVLDLAVSPPRLSSWPIAMHGSAGWTGRAGELLFQAYADTSLHLMSAATGTGRRIGVPDCYADLLAIWPDPHAPRAVFASGNQITVTRIESDGGLTDESRFLLGDGPQDRTGAWSGGPEIARFTPEGERLLFARGREMELWHLAKPKALLQVRFPGSIRDIAFAPDYEHLFVLTTDGTVHVCNPGTLTGVRAVLRWHVGPVSRLAVSPDSQFLATAGAEGVKLWPVGRLMSLSG